MNTYRSTQTTQAVQYLGEPIPEVTCSGTGADFEAHHCDGTRKHLPHVHTRATGGLSVLKEGDWIIPEIGGPFLVWTDAKFRAYFEVPAPTPVEVPAPALVKPEPEKSLYAAALRATAPIDHVNPEI